MGCDKPRARITSFDRLMQKHFPPIVTKISGPKKQAPVKKEPAVVEAIIVDHGDPASFLVFQA
jgi:hypothetical protein